jgi:hypothetical protein
VLEPSRHHHGQRLAVAIALPHIASVANDQAQARHVPELRRDVRWGESPQVAYVEVSARCAQEEEALSV